MISKEELKLNKLYDARTTFPARPTLFPYPPILLLTPNPLFLLLKKKSRKTERVGVEGNLTALAQLP